MRIEGMFYFFVCHVSVFEEVFFVRKNSNFTQIGLQVLSHKPR